MKPRKYLIVDVETCTLPEYSTKKSALTHPLIYDIGWVITDYKGTIYKKHSFLVQEIFFNEELFSTGYYSSKKPVYFSMLKNGEISVRKWAEIWSIFTSELSQVNFVCAYNAFFDLKLAIPFTYNFFNPKNRKNSVKNQPVFLEKPIIDIWAFSCNTFLNTFSYKKHAQKNNWFSPSKKYYSSTAEKAYAYLSNQPLFSESHTALEDVLIESFLLRACLKRSSAQPLLVPFPFRCLGLTPETSEKLSR